MSNLALYRKYRSADLTDVVGQSHIVDTLEASLNQGQLAHAYLFSGPRGVGKTSVARIMARRVNKLPKSEDITNYLDILEIDAASNRGIDDVRALREKLNSAPTQLNYKVIIIDEVHMLTKEAFNALLKTLEEPPAHVVFVLATTEAHKLPQTIISRTQRYEFRPFTQQQIADHLKLICKKEGIKYDDQGLFTIATLAGGSMRDAIGILDQLANLSQTLTEKIVQQFMGMAAQAQLQNIYQSVLSGNAKQSLELVAAQLANGVDETMLCTQLQRYFRSRLIQNSLDPTQLQKHILAIDLLLSATEQLKFAQIKSLPLEVAVVKISQLFELAKTSIPQHPQKPKDINHQNLPKTKPKKTKSISVDSTNGQNSQYVKALSIIKEHNNSLYALLRSGNARLIGDNLVVDCRFNFHKQRIEEPRNRETIEKIMSRTCKKPITLKCSINSQPEHSAKKVDPEKEIVNSAMAILGGELVDG